MVCFIWWIWSGKVTDLERSEWLWRRDWASLRLFLDSMALMRLVLSWCNSSMPSFGSRRNSTATRSHFYAR